jgi:copper chaperone CopZ
MDKISIRVRKEFCAECSMAIRRFMGHMKGVEDVTVEDGKITISFDGSKIAESDVLKLSKDSVEKLGYGIEEE